MFTKIQYTARVLASSFPEKPHPRDVPDIIFEKEDPIKVSKISSVIGSLLGVFVLSLAVAMVSSKLIAAFPKMTTHGVTTITAIAAGFLALLWQHFVSDVHKKLEAHLRVGERIAPYFGHKIARTISVLRG